MPLSSYSTTRDNNASIPPGDIRVPEKHFWAQQIVNAIRQLMADLAAMFSGTVSPTFNTMTAARARLTATDDVTLSSTLHAFQIGASSGANIAMDSNEIEARNNGATSTLNLQADGGLTALGGGLTTPGPVTITDMGGILATGSYTPTLTNSANLDASTVNTSFWIRIGNKVIVWVTGTIDQTALGALTDLGISLPVSSNLAGLNELGGAFNTAREAGTILGDAANNRAQARLIAATTANQSFSTVFAYLIV